MKRHFLWRAASLVIVAMVAYIWWTHNFGEGLNGVPWLAALAGAFTFGMERLEHSQQERFKDFLAKWLLSSVLLTCTCLVMLILLASFASVIVLDTGSEPLTVTLAPAANSSSIVRRDAEKEKPARFHLWITPLGRAYILKVKGFIPKTILVSSPMGLTLTPEADLTPQVVLIVRPTADGMSELASDGIVHVFRTTNNNDVEIAALQPQARASLLLGTERAAIPHDIVEDWRLELAGEKMSDLSRANQLRWWKTPRILRLKPGAAELAPKDKLTIQLQTANGLNVDCGSIELPDTSGSIVDLPLNQCAAPGGGHD
jgi:hypothetical protein